MIFTQELVFFQRFIKFYNLLPHSGDSGLGVFGVMLLPLINLQSLITSWNIFFTAAEG